MGFLFSDVWYDECSSKEASAMIEECLLNPPVREKGWFLWLVEMCAVLWVLWGEWNSKVFRGVERDSRDYWSFVCFHASLWASISKNFYN